jgi:hypothetical protein
LLPARELQELRSRPWADAGALVRMEWTGDQDHVERGPSSTAGTGSLAPAVEVAVITTPTPRARPGQRRVGAS